MTKKLPHDLAKRILTSSSSETSIETFEEFEMAFKSTSWYVRRVAVKSHFFTKEKMDEALADISFYVQEAAIESPHFDDNYLESILKSGDKFLIEKALVRLS